MIKPSSLGAAGCGCVWPSKPRPIERTRRFEFPGPGKSFVLHEVCLVRVIDLPCENIPNRAQPVNHGSARIELFPKTNEAILSRDIRMEGRNLDVRLKRNGGEKVPKYDPHPVFGTPENQPVGLDKRGRRFPKLDNKPVSGVCIFVLKTDDPGIQFGQPGRRVDFRRDSGLPKGTQPFLEMLVTNNSSPGITD